MKTMFVLISHTLMEEQKEDAIRRYGVERFVVLDTSEWSRIDPYASSVIHYLARVKQQMIQEATEGDLLFVQGDFGATFSMVLWAFQKGLVPVYATTQRRVTEEVHKNKVVTTHIFRHVRFRNYEKM